MRKMVWLLITLGFIAPLSLIMVRQMYTQQMLDDAMSIVTNTIPTLYTPRYVVISSLVFGLTAGTKMGRRTGRRLSWTLGHFAYEFFYHKTKMRLGWFQAMLWLGGWIGIFVSLWSIVMGQWLGTLVMVLYWGGLRCAYYLHGRYKSWQFLKFRLPGRLRWSGIWQEVKDAGDRWASSFRRRGHSRR